MACNEEGTQEVAVTLAGAEATDVVFDFNPGGSFTLEEERHLSLLSPVLQDGFVNSLSACAQDGTVQLIKPPTRQKENLELLSTSLLHNVNEVFCFALHIRLFMGPYQDGQ